MTALTLLLATLLTSDAPAPPVRVLLLSGRNNHDWKTTTPRLRSILASTGRFSVDVVEHPEKLTEQEFASHDVIVSNWNLFDVTGESWPEATRRAYLAAVRSGRGHVVVHAGSCSFYDWPEYRRLTLAAWGRDRTSHGPKHAFPLRAEPVAHPITSGLRASSTTDELWNRPAVDPGATVIASSFSSKEGGGTGQWEPTALVGRFGKGRTFTLLLGHDAESMESAAFRSLFTRGTEWAATGAVTLPMGGSR